MSFVLREVTDKHTWEGFLQKCSEKTFLISWNWGEFQKMMGSQIWRWGIYEQSESAQMLQAVCLVVKIGARRGTFLFVPHGPVILSENKGQIQEVLKALLFELKLLAREQEAAFVRLAPIVKDNKENRESFKNLGFREAPIHMHPELTWELDISQESEAILGQMRKTSRYLIRQAQKNQDISIARSRDIKDLGAFDDLYGETANRHHFVPFSKTYLQNELSAFQADEQILLLLGKYRGEVVSAGVFVYWQGISFYHHGASSHKFAKIPVSYLLQWEAILEAKKRDCSFHNFWGVAPLTKDAPPQIVNKSHPWAGLTLFKMGFGGYPKRYAHTQDFPLHSSYWISFCVEKIRKAKRRL